MTTQLITPNPNVPCRPGWCLEYVRTAYGLPIKYGSATEAWQKSTTQHPDWNFPAGCWVPVYFAIDTEPNGHIALLAPDGSVYSSSDLTNVPHHHPNIADLIQYYAYWGKMTLTYLGWTEDVASFPVVSNDTGSINVDSITPQEDDVVTQDDISAIAKATVALLMTEGHGGDTLGELIAEERPHHLDVMSAVASVAARLDKGIVISRTQAEDIVAATTARTSAYVGQQAASLSAAVTAATAPATGVDVTALAQQLAPALGSALGEQFITALRNQLNKP